MRTIRITLGGVSLSAELDDRPTAEAIWDLLPITAAASTWGDEIYCGIPLERELEADARETVAVGELGYWPAGRAFCIFFGPTPASTDEVPRAASAVTVIGRVRGDVRLLRQVPAGSTVRLEPATP